MFAQSCYFMNKSNALLDLTLALRQYPDLRFTVFLFVLLSGEGVFSSKHFKIFLREGREGRALKHD